MVKYSPIADGLHAPAEADLSFVVTGPAFAGAATLAHLLARHPRARIHPEDLQAKELGIGDALRPLPTSVAEEGNGRMPGCLRQEYLTRPEAVEALVGWPGRVLIALRDPVQRARAHHMAEVRLGREHRSFRLAIRDYASSSEPERELTRQYLKSGYYFEHVHRLVEGLGRHRVHVVLFEELLAEPEEVLYSVAMFLGIEPARVDLRQWPRVQGEEPPATGLLARLLPWRGQNPDTGPAARLRERYRSDITALERYLYRDLQVLRGRGD